MSMIIPCNNLYKADMNKQKLINAYIVDDSQDAIEVLKIMLESNFSVEVVGSSCDAEKAIKEISQLAPDLIFTDVEMPTMTGIELCSKLKDCVSPNTRVVFYTGYDKYMIDAIRQRAFDYLMKPPMPQDVAQIITRYYEDRLTAIQKTVMIDDEQRQPPLLVVNAFNEHIPLQADNIAFFRFNQEQKIWEAVCCDGRIFALRTRTNAEIILHYSADFVQIHKRYIVNISHVKMIQNSACILTIPNNSGDELKISKVYRRAFMNAFYSL